MISTLRNTKIEFSSGEIIDLKDFFYFNFQGLSTFAARYIPDKILCEDIVQEVFINFWEKQRSFPNVIAVKAFLYTSVRNLCLDHLKHEKVKAKFQTNQLYRQETTESFLEAVIRKEAYNEIYHEIDKLPEMGKKVLLLALREKSNDEIAMILNIAINTVKTHKARAYKVLRRTLNDLFLFFSPLRSRIESTKGC